MVVGVLTTGTQVLVIGGGPAGYTAAIRAAQLGKEVTLVERQEIGGVCLHSGCIPSKSLLTASGSWSQLKDLESMGIEVSQAHLDLEKMKAWKENVVQQLAEGVKKLLRTHRVQVVHGEATFSSTHEVRVTSEFRNETYQFEHCIIATGARMMDDSHMPPFDGTHIQTPQEALQLNALPAALCVVGNDCTALELASIYNNLGSEVSLLSTARTWLPEFEPSLVRILMRQLKQSGVTIHAGIELKEFFVQDEKVKILVSSERGEELVFTSDKAVVCSERVANTNGLDLEAAGVTLGSRGEVVVDEQQRTTTGHIFAVGDVVGGEMLAHVGISQGKVTAEVIAGGSAASDAYAVPRVVFSDPEIASVGLTEKEAKEKGYEPLVGRFPFGASGRSLASNRKEGFVQVVAERSSKQILGVHMVGPDCTNLVGEAALAIEMGATLDDLALTLHSHPTLSEALLEAAEAAMGLAIHVTGGLTK